MGNFWTLFSGIYIPDVENSMTSDIPDVDRIFRQFATYLKRAMGGRQVGGEELDHEQAKQAIKQLVVAARIDELNNFGEDEGSSGTYYLKVNGGNLNDRINQLKGGES